MTEPTAIILAAGKGTRMNSDLPKVLHHVGGRAMVCAVVDACLEAGCGRVVAVVGHGEPLVRDALAGYGARILFARQPAQLGTGHAVRCAMPELDGLSDGAEVFVLCGDGPLIRAATLRTILARHRDFGASATLATSVVADPEGYGRIVRDAQGRFSAIVEQKHATPAQRAIREINPSYYCFSAGALRRALGSIRPSAGGEEYITDAPALLLAAGERVEVIDAVPPEDVLSINTPEQLEAVDRVFRARSPARAAGGQR
jgi:bifunctional UDP-N-acetylglucosamine pyrophosphorylase/glucosamine-1-phosphate N-acetyltransferase